MTEDYGPHERDVILDRMKAVAREISFQSREMEELIYRAESDDEPIELHMVRFSRMLGTIIDAIGPPSIIVVRETDEEIRFPGFSPN